MQVNCKCDQVCGGCKDRGWEVGATLYIAGQAETIVCVVEVGRDAGAGGAAGGFYVMAP